MPDPEVFNMKTGTGIIAGTGQAPGLYGPPITDPASDPTTSDAPDFDPFADPNEETDLDDDAINGFTDEDDAVIGDDNDPENA